MLLSDMNVGQIGLIKGINTNTEIKRRLYDIGLIEKTKIKCIMKSLSGDPKAYLIRGTIIAIREEDGKLIEVEIL